MSLHATPLDLAPHTLHPTPYTLHTKHSTLHTTPLSHTGPSISVVLTDSCSVQRQYDNRHFDPVGSLEDAMSLVHATPFDHTPFTDRSTYFHGTHTPFTDHSIYFRGTDQ